MAREGSLSPWDTTVRLRAYGDLDVQTPKGSSRRDQRGGEQMGDLLDRNGSG